MSETFEWFDPFEEKQRADREAARARVGIETGRRQVEDAISRATRDHLSEKMEMAVAGLADKIARHVAYNLAADRAHWDVMERQGPACAEAFRAACREVLGGGLQFSDRSRVRASGSRSLESREDTMTIEYETLQPIRIAHSIRL